jgi:hypothetical protein
MEIVTIGDMLTSSVRNGQIMVWTWDGKRLLLRRHTEWGDPSGGDVDATAGFVGDIDHDGAKEIVTVGFSGSSPQLRIWNARDLSLEKSIEYGQGNGFTSVYAADIDRDGIVEIVTVRLTSPGTELRIWNWTGRALTLEKEEFWDRFAFDVVIADVDNDGDQEIVTVGDVVINAAGEGQAQLRIWRWDGATLILEKRQDWVVGIQSAATEARAEDIDGDGQVEIVTLGRPYTDRCQGEISIWRWDGTQLDLEKRQLWEIGVQTACTGGGFAIANIDADPQMEIVTAGSLGTFERSQIRIWNWDGVTLSLEKSHDWGPEIPYAVFVDDVDNDGVPEILTGAVGELRIWSF